MFNNAGDHGVLTSILALPLESTSRPHISNHSNHSSFDFDSIIDDEQRSSQEDLLFEKTHYRSSMSSDSVFGDDYPLQNGLLPPNQFQPLSVHSTNSIHSPMKEDDTMISMSSIPHFFNVCIPLRRLITKLFSKGLKHEVYTDRTRQDIGRHHQMG